LVAFFSPLPLMLKYILSLGTVSTCWRRTKNYWESWRIWIQGSGMLCLFHPELFL